jgi:hypothetical protein
MLSATIKYKVYDLFYFQEFQAANRKSTINTMNRMFNSNFDCKMIRKFFAALIIILNLASVAKSDEVICPPGSKDNCLTTHINTIDLYVNAGFTGLPKTVETILQVISCTSCFFNLAGCIGCMLSFVPVSYNTNSKITEGDHEFVDDILLLEAKTHLEDFQSKLRSPDCRTCYQTQMDCDNCTEVIRPFFEQRLRPELLEVLRIQMRCKSCSDKVCWMYCQSSTELPPELQQISGF